jgi:hypothetical protein
VIPKVRTDRTVANDKPDFIISDNKEGTPTLTIGGAITGDRNVIKKGLEKLSQYAALTTHAECDSKNDTGNNMATGTVTNSLRQHLSNVQGE